MSNEIDNANTPQEFWNLPFAYVWNLIAWNYTSMSLGENHIFVPTFSHDSHFGS